MVNKWKHKSIKTSAEAAWFWGDVWKTQQCSRSVAGNRWNDPKYTRLAAVYCVTWCLYSCSGGRGADRWPQFRHVFHTLLFLSLAVPAEGRWCFAAETANTVENLPGTHRFMIHVICGPTHEYLHSIWQFSCSGTRDGHSPARTFPRHWIGHHPDMYS